LLTSNNKDNAFISSVNTFFKEGEKNKGEAEASPLFFIFL